MNEESHLFMEKRIAVHGSPSSSSEAVSYTTFPSTPTILLGPMTKVTRNTGRSDACHFTLPCATPHSFPSSACQMWIPRVTLEASAGEGGTSGSLDSCTTAWSRILPTPCWLVYAWVRNKLLLCWAIEVIYNGMLLSHEKRNDILSFTATRIDLEGIMLSERNQTEKDKYCMLSLIRGI